MQSRGARYALVANDRPLRRNGGQDRCDISALARLDRFSAWQRQGPAAPSTASSSSCFSSPASCCMNSAISSWRAITESRPRKSRFCLSAGWRACRGCREARTGTRRRDRRTAGQFRHRHGASAVVGGFNAAALARLDDPQVSLVAGSPRPTSFSPCSTSSPPFPWMGAACCAPCWRCGSAGRGRPRSPLRSDRPSPSSSALSVSSAILCSSSSRFSSTSPPRERPR